MIRSKSAHISQSLLINFQFRTIYDAPCGDFNWMRLCVSPQIEYSGADIVPDLIAANQKHHHAHNVKFFVADIVVDRFPNVDLWICRDCFMHLSYKDITQSLSHFCASSSKYILLETFVGDQNMDIETGHWRRNDLSVEPFNFPTPRYSFFEYIEPNPAKQMVLFTREDIATCLPKMKAALAHRTFEMAPVR